MTTPSHTGLFKYVMVYIQESLKIKLLLNREPRSNVYSDQLQKIIKSNLISFTEEFEHVSN